MRDWIDLRGINHVKVYFVFLIVGTHRMCQYDSNNSIWIIRFNLLSSLIWIAKKIIFEQKILWNLQKSNLQTVTDTTSYCWEELTSSKSFWLWIFEIHVRKCQWNPKSILWWQFHKELYPTPYCLWLIIPWTKIPATTKNFDSTPFFISKCMLLWRTYMALPKQDLAPFLS